MDVRSRAWLVFLALAGLALAGCSSSIATPSIADSPVPTVEPAAPTNEELAEYFSAVAGSDPVELTRVATDLAAPNSNAYAYAVEQGAMIQALLDGGYPRDAQGIKSIEGGFAVCPQAAATVDETCSEFTNLTYLDGRLADFDAGDSPLAGRITLGNGESIPLGDVATVTFLAAYRSISDAVYVIVEIRSNVDGLAVSYSSPYSAPSGRQSDASDVVGPRELGSGALANYAFVYEGAEFGGVVNLIAYDSNYDEVSAQIPTA